MEIPPDDPAEAEKERSRYETLLALYPRERAREMIKAYLDAEPVDDSVILPDTSAEELEAEMSTLDEGLDGADPQMRTEVEAMKQLFRDAFGEADGCGKDWLEAVCVSVALTPEQARELQASWAASLRTRIDAATDGYVLWSDDFVIRKDARGYILRAVSLKP